MTSHSASSSKPALQSSSVRPRRADVLSMCCVRGERVAVIGNAVPQVLRQAGRSIVVLLLPGLLAACASPDPASLAYVPERQARIRVFHGTAAYLHLGDICDGDTHPVIHAAAGGFSYLVPNKTIGMPATDDMPRSFHEYVIPAGEPVTVTLYWQAQNASGTWEHCGPIHMMFTPEAGRDYDTFMKFRRGVCQGVEVRKFVPGLGGNITTSPAPLNRLPFRRCPESDLWYQSSGDLGSNAGMATRSTSRDS